MCFVKENIINNFSNTDLANAAEVSKNTIINWKREKPELIKLIITGLATKQYLEKTKNYFQEQKDLLEVSETKYNLKENKVKKIDLAERINVTSATLINWEKTKPNLIKLIDLAITSEIHIQEIEYYISLSENK